MARTAAAFVRADETDGCLRDEPHAIASAAPSLAAFDTCGHAAEAGDDPPLVERDGGRDLRVRRFESEPDGPTRARRTYVVAHRVQRSRASRGAAA